MNASPLANFVPKLKRRSPQFSSVARQFAIISALESRAIGKGFHETTGSAWAMPEGALQTAGKDGGYY
jgi:hypothetical protein